jgi:hypothetical protein
MHSLPVSTISPPPSLLVTMTAAEATAGAKSIVAIIALMFIFFPLFQFLVHKDNAGNHGQTSGK